MSNADDSGTGKLVLLGVFVAVLMVILSWSFSINNVVAGSLRLKSMLICEEMNEDMTPLRISEDIPGGARQICLWFDYSRARDGDFIEIVWLHEGRNIQSEAFRISEPDGARAFFLLRQDGSEFPSGKYSVVIYCNGREKGIKNFRVEASSEDLSLVSEEVLSDDIQQ